MSSSGLADELGASIQRPDFCDACGLPIVGDDTDVRHTPDTRVLHADCCDECEDS